MMSLDPVYLSDRATMPHGSFNHTFIIAAMPVVRARASIGQHVLTSRSTRGGVLCRPMQSKRRQQRHLLGIMLGACVIKSVMCTA